MLARTLPLCPSLCLSAWNALAIITTESYSTELGSTSFGVLNAANRVGAIVGNVVYGHFLSTNPAVPIFLTALFLVGAGFSALLLPNRIRRIQES